MTPSILGSLITLSLLFFLGSVSAIPASPPSLITNSIETPASNPAGWTWLWISGDGSQIVPVSGPQEVPKNLTGTNGLTGPYSGDSYTFGFANFHGAAHPRPALAKFLFECEFGLFGQVPASGPGVWTAYPNAVYGCYGNPGVLRMNRAEQSTGWLMAYHDLAFLIKVLHDTQGVKDEAPWFDFQFGWSNQTGVHPHVPIVNGKWDQTYGGSAVKSVQ